LENDIILNFNPFFVSSSYTEMSLEFSKGTKIVHSYGNLKSYNLFISNTNKKKYFIQSTNFPKESSIFISYSEPVDLKVSIELSNENSNDFKFFTSHNTVRCSSASEIVVNNTYYISFDYIVTYYQWNITIERLTEVNLQPTYPINGYYSQEDFLNDNFRIAKECPIISIYNATLSANQKVTFDYDEQYGFFMPVMFEPSQTFKFEQINETLNYRNETEIQFTREKKPIYYFSDCGGKASFVTNQSSKYYLIAGYTVTGQTFYSNTNQEEYHFVDENASYANFLIVYTEPVDINLTFYQSRWAYLPWDIVINKQSFIYNDINKTITFRNVSLLYIQTGAVFSDLIIKRLTPIHSKPTFSIDNFYYRSDLKIINEENIETKKKNDNLWVLAVVLPIGIMFIIGIITLCVITKQNKKKEINENNIEASNEPTVEDKISQKN